MNRPILAPLSKYANITKLAGFEYTKHFDYGIGGEIIALRSLNIRNGKIDLSDVHTVPREVSDALPRSKLRSGDIVLGYIGSKLGNLALIEDDDRFHLAPNVALIRPLSGVEPRFLLMFMQAPYYQSQLWALASSTGQPALSMASIRKSEVWLPEASEQRRIAEILSTWDCAIETVEALITNARAQKKALMQSLLTGKKRLAGFSGAWQETPIAKMGNIVAGGTPDSTDADCWGGDIAWATPTDITKLRTRYISQTERYITPLGLSSSAAKRLPAGTVIVCTRATVGALAIATVPMTTNQGFKNIVPNGKHDSDFIYFLLSQNKKALVRAAGGSTFAEVSKADFEKLTFPVPQVDEQRSIAAVLICADEALEKLQSKLTGLRQEKSALMQQLLTGKRRVMVEAQAA